ncbi:uncharacterized protein FOMMEDRAFT_19134 [Fomitiporia mediterranea MF3/22]|uniref:uncharacterized protein n=1 Tax=Fomitiporia mediterranea (strain MF3/22) TaxID=694068 RepID=UPI00044097C2|nr:uncharacterized protein FOMMEDRAFT_19134 [Fomitiporia mediterranea MF3/22]EJD03772.1 hypothetical protein FOMMEDRAFT_19134 [Fomitiporia mediterranea MF3/22]
MRFHVLGLGPVGQLIAFHLRRSLSPKHAVSIMFKDRTYARRMRGLPLHVEYDGVVSSVAGFETESSRPPQNSWLSSTPQTPGDDRNGLQEARWSGPVVPSRDELQSTSVSEEEEVAEERHIDSLFVACKAQSTLPAIKEVEHRLSSDSTIVLLQNGNLRVHELLMEKVFTNPANRPNIILVSNTHGIWLKRAPFHIVHAGIGQLRFGIVPDGRRDFEKSLHASDNDGHKPRLHINDIALPKGDHEVTRYRSLRNTVAVLQKVSALRTSWEPFSTMQVILRQKLVVNCVINPLTAILGCRNGELFEHEAGGRMAYRVCTEASLVFRAEALANRREGTSLKDVYIPPELSNGALIDECKRVAKITENNMSSMLADLKKGKKVTEVEFLNGHLLTLGNRYDLRLPINASLLDLMLMRSQIPLDTML